MINGRTLWNRVRNYYLREQCEIQDVTKHKKNDANIETIVQNIWTIANWQRKKKITFHLEKDNKKSHQKDDENAVNCLLYYYLLLFVYLVNQ